MGDKRRRRTSKVSSIKSTIERRNRELKDSNDQEEIDKYDDSDDLYKINKTNDREDQSTNEKNDKIKTSDDSDKEKHEEQNNIQNSNITDEKSQEDDSNEADSTTDESTTDTSLNSMEHDNEKTNEHKGNKTKKQTLNDRLIRFRDNRRAKQQEKEEHLAHLTPQERREHQRKVRRIRQKRIQYIIITILVLLILLFLIYMFTPLSRISNVKISGNNNISDSKIEKALDVKDSSRMYTYSKSKGISNLKKNDLIKDVKIEKQLPNTLKVQIVENEVVGVVKDKNNYVPVIEGNKELKNYDGDIAGSGPILDGFKGDDKDNMIKALSKMPSEVRNMIAEINYAPEQNSPNRILLYMKDDMQVVGNMKTIANKIKYYPQMSQSLSKDSSGNLKNEGYIDLSVGASFIPNNENSSVDSKSDQNVRQKSQQETDAKDELQSALNKINEQSDSNN